MLTLEHRQYPTYLLTDPKNATLLEVVPDRGGIVTRWQVQGQELLYLDAERFTNLELTVRGGIPILFPICGNLPDNTYTYKGTPYQLKQHGFARDLPWTVTNSPSIDSPNLEATHLTLTLTSNEQTRSLYPFDFQVEFTYILQGTSLLIQQAYTNHSPEVMPFSTGLHPYFWVSDKTQLQFQIPATEYQNQQDQTIHPFAGNFDFDRDEIDVAFSASEPAASVTDLDRQLCLTLESDPTYSTLVFWTIKGKDYYCLEPWTARRNALNTGDRLTYLSPGETLTTLVKMTVQFL